MFTVDAVEKYMTYRFGALSVRRRKMFQETVDARYINICRGKQQLPIPQLYYICAVALS